ncbi:MAG: hypothetical protein PUC65_01560 [Clostridiales bacterium]|nr:hypothetical protein [Clostridiales bacterium]
MDFVFSLFYIGFVFICIVATILAVQQLSEASQYRYRYRILSNLGVETKKIHRLVFKQLSFYFGLPLILPVTISMWMTICIHRIYQIYIDNNYLVLVIVRTLGLFFFVYLLYFIATYVGYIKNVNKNQVREE